MKVLWFCNVGLRTINKYLNDTSALYAGGWLEGISESLLKNEEFELVYCYPSDPAQYPRKGRIENLTFYEFPISYKEKTADIRDNSAAVELFRQVIQIEKPDLLHFFGTEYLYTKRLILCAKQCGYAGRIVTSIQGLVSIYSFHFYADLPQWVPHMRTFSELKNRNNMRDQRNNMIHRGISEKSALMNSDYVIGRTSWDKACVSLMAPRCQYLFCNETLRGPFYDGKWSLKDCHQHQIMITQASYPIKGFHKVVEAVAMIQDKYPDIRILVTGYNIFEGNLIRGNSYGNYINWLLKKYGMREKVTFLGGVGAEKMKELMLQSNLFICPSSIENSPNSLGEAMLLGMPCIASDVGGVADMMTPEKEGLVYPFNEHYKMAYEIDRIFSDGNLAESLGRAAQQHARETHSRTANNARLTEIYQMILDGTKCKDQHSG